LAPTIVMHSSKDSLEGSSSSMTPSLTEEAVDLTEMEDSATLNSAEWETSMKHNSTEEAHQTTLTEGSSAISFNTELAVRAEGEQQ